ncbi:HlyD family secretion protein [Pararhizobium sp.]|uniref:HlyD family secretion protein n=1 Tax=Pararhizobium sp. TaxID=1977563 RepID=UPI002727F19A|nr:HlyD family secretion protein [Pararhizobium sp.]MDO9415280.1 HlyD family secretion protein [Pararhizobium sp.]
MSASKNSASAKVRAVDEDFQEQAAAVAPEASESEAKREAVSQPVEAAVQPAANPDAEKPKSSRRFVLPIIILAALSAGGYYGYEWWTNGRFMVSTDDAYIEGDIASISPKVSGYIEKINVTANQAVKAGDPLITLENGDYRIAAEQAKAQIRTQQLALKRIDAQIAGAEAAVAQAEAQKTSSEASVRSATLSQQRASDLKDKAVGTVASLDSAQVALDQANANLLASKANITAAQANIAVLQAQRAEAESSVRSLQLADDKAERDLSFTVLKAPYDGIIGNLSVQTGDLVSAGQRLAALVPVQQLYIEANFKETQIEELVPGSKVKVHVDAYDQHPVEGTVLSISPASGSVFSLLPAENATGNFTKVIQRIPVRIGLPKEALESGRLRAGLSVVVDVDTRTAPDGAAVAAAE